MTDSPTTTKAAMTVAEVADMLGVVRTTVDRYTRSGQIPSFKIGGLRRYDRDAVETAWEAIKADSWLDVRQAARRLNVSAELIRETAAAGKIPAAKTGNAWRFNVDQLEQWIANGGSGGAA